MLARCVAGCAMWPACDKWQLPTLSGAVVTVSVGPRASFPPPSYNQQVSSALLEMPSKFSILEFILHSPSLSS